MRKNRKTVSLIPLAALFLSLVLAILPMTSAHNVQYIEEVTSSYNARNPDYIEGLVIDHNYCELPGFGPYGLNGCVAGRMHVLSPGWITAFGFINYGSGDLAVFTSNDGYSWTLLATVTISNTSPEEIFLCYSSTSFQYMALMTVPGPFSNYVIYLDCAG